MDTTNSTKKDDTQPPDTQPSDTQPDNQPDTQTSGENSSNWNTEDNDERVINPHDSLTLGQLKKLIKQHQSNSKSHYNEQGFKMDYDTYLDLPSEINEFYSYTEIPRHLEAKKIFEDNISNWEFFDIQTRNSEIEIWLETLETSDRANRFKASMCLLYLAQGQFEQRKSSQEHLEILIRNNKHLRKLNAIQYYYSGLKIACGTHDILAQTYWTGSNVDINKMSEVNLEIGLMLSLLYFYIEVNRGSKDDFDIELANLEPSLPQFLFGLVAKLKEKSFKGYPIKKVLLLLWKVLLTVNGDFSSVKELANYNRLRHSLPPSKSPESLIKVDSEEYNLYHWEIMHKYPTCFSMLKSDPFLKAPVTNTKWVGDGPRPSMPNITNIPNMSIGSFYSNSIVPTPTPFVFPTRSKSPKIPKPIQEALDLYDTHLEFSLGHLQTITEQNSSNSSSGKDKNPSKSFKQNENLVNPKLEAQLDRIEALYKAILPDAHSIVVILLKLLLATIPNSKPNESNTSNDGTTVSIVETTPSHLSVEEVDDIRHKEIVAKSVSAILLLILKQFKASHILRYEYWCTLLVDTNAILLILKMYGLQDFASLVAVRNECDNMGFFRSLIPNLNSDTSQLKSVSNPNDPNEVLLGRGRNLFTAINFFKILNKLCKKKLSRLLLLIQFKSSAILKRGLKISHPMLNKYILKVIQYQVPYLGRKWRQANMKIITMIYLTCRSGLREDWLLPSEIDQYAEIQQNNLRQLITTFHKREYGMKVLNSIHGQPSVSDLLHSPAPSQAPNFNQIHLDEEFLENYDIWLESEVFSNEMDDLHLGDPDFWAVSATEDEDELDDWEDLDPNDLIDPNLIDSGIKRPPSPPLMI